MTRLFSHAGHRWAGQDHGRWEPPCGPEDTRADRIAEWTAEAMSDAGAISDFIADGIELPALTCQMLASIDRLDVESKAKLAMDIHAAIERAAIARAEIAMDLEYGP